VHQSIAPREFSFKDLVQRAIHPDRLSRQLKTGAASEAALSNNVMTSGQRLLEKMGAHKAGTSGDE
jgi:hypothetical protein